MTRTLTLCVAALLTVSPAFAQSVTVSAPQTQALSPTLGATESLPIVTPEEAAALIQVPVVETLPPSGEVSSTLGTTESLPVVTPALAETLSAQPTVEREGQRDMHGIGGRRAAPARRSHRLLQTLIRGTPTHDTTKAPPHCDGAFFSFTPDITPGRGAITAAFPASARSGHPFRR